VVNSLVEIMRGLRKISQDKGSILRENRDLSKSITKRTYFVGLIVIFASAYSQYLVRGFDLASGMLVVYGIPLVITSVLYGRAIAQRAFNRTLTALKFGLGLFGAFTVLGTLASIAVFYIIVSFDPAAVNLLHRPNPVLHVPQYVAWIMVCASFLVVGPAEEYLFRGFIYGGLLSIFKERHWLSLALVSSLLFAAAHLYYAVVYGIDSVIPFIDITTFGIAMAITYYFSNGNLFVPAMIHGAYDATGFLGIAVSLEVGILFRGALISIGVIVASALLIQRTFKRRGLLIP
jgi:membrane protease YdiL (CAAX protease family)